MAYRSKHRLVNKQVATIHFKQPAQTTIKEIKQPAPPSKISGILEQLQSWNKVKDINIRTTVEWLHDNKHPVVPEHTSHPSNTPVSDLAVVTVCHGTDPLRVAASKKAIPRLLRANPQPAGFFVVEALEEGQASSLDYLKSYPQVTIIQVKIADKNKGLFQKEALWTIGTKKAFENPKITKILAIDADCCFDDNSWAYKISEKLNKCPFVQPYLGMNYSNQKDAGYGPSHILISEAYSLTNKCEGERFSPGGSFSCTRKFFENTFEGRWPYRPVGAGDVATWAFLRGNKTESAKKPSNVEDSMILDDGQCPAVPIGYVDLILNHFYHGPLSNRMYVTRNYLAKKYNNPETVVLDEQGLLSWADTIDGKIFQEAFTMLKKKTNEYVSVNRRFTLYDTKAMTKIIANKYYGSINSSNPLIITSVYRHGYDKSKETITNLYKALLKYCKNPFKFILFTDTNFDAPFTQIPLNLNCVEAPSMWRRMSIFQKEYDQNDNVLFIDPSTSIVNEFTMSACPDKHLYLARHDSGRWDSALMYFKNLPRIFEQYQELIKNKTILRPEYIYLEPSMYLLANWHDKGIVFKNAIIHADYKFTGERESYPTIDFILK